MQVILFITERQKWHSLDSYFIGHKSVEPRGILFSTHGAQWYQQGGYSFLGDCYKQNCNDIINSLAPGGLTN